MPTDLQHQLLACLYAIDKRELSPQSIKKLMAAITEVEAADKPIYDDEALTRFLVTLLIDDAPDLLINDKNQQLIDQFCANVKYSFNQAPPKPRSKK